ncbi:MAG: carboxypeptidase-like regulatory domain-containing protein, partial [Acidobacteria bacterium]|nr:carboxypeptidase-like regulatory domain-containing protein [Acidobacteriota bacterium]
MISDATGGVAPGVEVVVRNVDTGSQRIFTTDGSGRYSAPELVPGTYEITATLAGFDTLVRSGITLTVGQQTSINLTMQVGAITQQVTVTGEAPLVNTTTSGVSGVVEERRITELPLNGRDFSSLALVQPGVFSIRNAARDNPNKGYGTRVSLAGSRPMETGWLL